VAEIENTIDDPGASEVQAVLYAKEGSFYQLIDLTLKMDGQFNRYLPTHLSLDESIFRLERVSDDGKKVYYQALY